MTLLWCKIIGRLQSTTVHENLQRSKKFHWLKTLFLTCLDAIQHIFHATKVASPKLLFFLANWCISFYTVHFMQNWADHKVCSFLLSTKVLLMQNTVQSNTHGYCASQVLDHIEHDPFLPCLVASFLLSFHHPVLGIPDWNMAFPGESRSCLIRKIIQFKEVIILRCTVHAQHKKKICLSYEVLKENICFFFSGLPFTLMSRIASN